MCLTKVILCCVIIQFFLKADAISLDLSETYVVKKVDDIFNNIIVEPRAFNNEYSHKSKRTKRYVRFEDNNVDSDLKEIYDSANVLTLQIEDWIFVLEENNFLSFGNNFEETWISSKKEDKTVKKDERESCKFYTGEILYEPASKAIITICDKNRYYGFFTSNDKSYFIEPTVHPQNGHIVYKANLPNSEESTRKTKSNMKEKTDANGHINGEDLNISLKNEKSTHKRNISSGPGNWEGSRERKEGLDFKRDHTFYFEENLYNRRDNVKKIKRDAPFEAMEIFNLTGDTNTEDINFNFGDEERKDFVEHYNKVVVKDDKENDSYDDYDEKPSGRSNWHKKHMLQDDHGYFIDTAWLSRPLLKYKTGNPTRSSQERWLEIAMAVDYTVINFHGKDKIRQYVMALMNIVSAIYKDPSLGANLHLVMSRLIFYDDKKDSMIKVGNAKKSLEAVNRWNYKLIGRLRYDEKPHDVAIWLTREYIGGPSGYAPVSGACNRSRSSAINKDEGLASAFIIAHEMAHILGLTHDGDEKAGNKCIDEVVNGTIMAPTVTANFHHFTWSSCSREEFHRLINQWNCLLNPPQEKNHTILQSGTSEIYTMDEQCRMEHGDGYVSCKNVDITDPCTHLWCGHKNSMLCYSKNSPPIEGTQCGYDKWCSSGYCQHVDGRLSGSGRKHYLPKAGGWSSWSGWSKCSRNCGYGVRTRKRSCNNPEPSWGGAECQGPDEETEVCRHQRHCWEAPSSDPWADRCSRLPEQEGKKPSTWLPYETGDDDQTCHVTCSLWETGEVVRSSEHLPDGTPCSYNNAHHICIEGKCHKYGCDGVENSTASEDRCGQCHGRGDSCFENHLVFFKSVKKELTRLLVLPRHSRGILLRVTLQSEEEYNNQIIRYSEFHLALRDRQKRLFRMEARGAGDTIQLPPQSLDPSNSVWSGFQEGPSVVLAGSVITTWRPLGLLTLSSKGPLHSDVVVMLSSPSEYIKLVEARVEVNYTLGVEDVGRYKWTVEEHQPCHCGVPIRPTPPKCVDTKRGSRTVHNSHCSKALKPLVKVEPCQSCDFHWIAGPWEYCTTTCGTNGTSHRQLYCVPHSLENEISPSTLIDYMVDPRHCLHDKPHQDQPCNVISCPGYWIEEPWTECSSECGLGISSRPLRCSSPNEEDCGSKPNLRWRSCRGSCNKVPKSKLNICNQDRSPYCALPSIARYCTVASFARLCCKSCEE